MTQFTCKGVKQINNWISLNMTFTFTIHISRRFLSAREFQMWNFQKYWSQNVGQDIIVHDFFHGLKILKVDGRDGRDPQNREKNAPAGSFTCMSIWSWLFISVPMPLIDIHVRLLRRIGKTSVTANRWERYIIKVYYKLRRVPINTCSNSPVNMWKTLNKLQQKNKVTYYLKIHMF